MKRQADSHRLAIARGKFSMPIEAATESFAILGRRGSGKTHTGAVFVEEMYDAGVQVVVIDPTDVWWGLRVSKDGKSAGLPIYVFGGSRADVPLKADSGALLADVVVDCGVSVVLCVRHLSKKDQRRFVAEFGERLYDAKSAPEKRTPLHLVLDEADMFVPQRLTPGTETCFGAVDTIIRRGRSSGLATTLISQRPQVINKDVLSQTEVLIAHQLIGAHDRKALEAWIEANDVDDHRDEFMGSLASMPRGHAWVWSPGLLSVFEKIRVRERRTFDSSSTPKPGVKVVKPRVFAPVDLKRLTTEINQVAEAAKANDPRALRARILTLEAQLVSVTKRSTEDDSAGRLRRGMTDVANRFAAVAAKLNELLGSATASSAAVEPTPPVAPNLVLDTVSGKAARTIRFEPPATLKQTEFTYDGAEAAADTSMPEGELKILTAAAQTGGTDKGQLKVLTGYKRSSVDAYLSRLRAKGFVTIENGVVVTTPAGKRALGPSFKPLPIGTQLRDYWYARLPAGEALILRHVIAAPNGLDTSELLSLTPYKRSSRDAFVSRLVQRKLVRRRQGGLLVPAAELFD